MLIKRSATAAFRNSKQHRVVALGSKGTLSPPTPPPPNIYFGQQRVFLLHSTKKVHAAETFVTKLVRCQVLTAASMKFRFVFWYVLPCKIIVDNYFTRQYIPEDKSELLQNMISEAKSSGTSVTSPQKFTWSSVWH
jgi:hypothetical protein